MRVLVAYASAHGSTREIAERLALTLGHGGLTTTLSAADRVQDVADHDAVVLGSAIHNSSWLPDAVDLVRRIADDLGDRPVWLFSVGMVDALRPALRGWAATEKPKVIESFARPLRPRDHRLFSGVINSTHLPLLGRLMFRVMGGRYGDYRDWPAVDAFAEDIARVLSTRQTG